MQLTCEHVTMAYEGKNVIENLSFSIDKGDYLCILGENGSGKSTLVKGILGLKKPSGGKIEYGSGVKRTKIGYLPQQTPAQKDFPASVLEVVLSGCLNSCGFLPFYTKKQKIMAQKAMESLGISDLKAACYRNLSGGQQQRVLLSRALCAAEDMLLLDEPVTGLDPVAAKEMYAVIRMVNKKGTSVIMISHDVVHAIKNATHILHLHEGGAFFGSTEAYLKSDVFKKFGGGAVL